MVESHPQDKQIVQKSLVTAMLCSSDAMRLDVYRNIQKVNRFCLVCGSDTCTAEDEHPLTALHIVQSGTDLLPFSCCRARWKNA